MTTLSSKWPTLLDKATRTDPDGGIATIAELMSQSNPILGDAPWKAGNKSDGEIHTGRSSLGTASWRRYNEGTEPTKTTTTQYTDSVGMLNLWAEVDAKMAEDFGDVAAFRASEEQGLMEGLNQEFAGTLFYGNVTTAPKEFTGIAPRYAAYGSDVTTSHVFNAGAESGQTDVTSIYLVGWSERTVYCLYGKNATAGIQRKDYGRIRGTDSDGYPIELYSAHYQWDCGLGVKDWRYIVRISNIDVSNMTTVGEADAVNPNLIGYMLRSIHLLPSLNGIRPVFYAHPLIVGLLAKQVLEKTNMALSIKDVTDANGLQIPGTVNLLGVPVRGCEQISLTETLLTA